MASKDQNKMATKDQNQETNREQIYTRHVGPVLKNEKLTQVKGNLSEILSDPGFKSFWMPTVVPTYLTANDRGGGEVIPVRVKLWDSVTTPPHFNYPERVHLIYDLGDMWDEALEDIMASPIIGIKLEGVRLHRSGVLKSLSVTTSSAVYVFDVILIEGLFKYGMRWVLESEDILKVVHDVREANDILFHDFQVNLRNVFDTCMADSQISTLLTKSRQAPMFARSYQSLCIEYLGIPDESLFFNIRRENRLEEDSRRFWSSIPFSEDMVLALARNCIYLLGLHRICMKGLLYNFNTANNAFVNQIRDMDSYRASLASEYLVKQPHALLQENEDEVEEELKEEEENEDEVEEELKEEEENDSSGLAVNNEIYQALDRNK